MQSVLCSRPCCQKCPSANRRRSAGSSRGPGRRSTVAPARAQIGRCSCAALARTPLGCGLRPQTDGTGPSTGARSVRLCWRRTGLATRDARAQPTTWQMCMATSATTAEWRLPRRERMRLLHLANVDDGCEGQYLAEDFAQTPRHCCNALDHLLEMCHHGKLQPSSKAALRSSGEPKGQQREDKRGEMGTAFPLSLPVRLGALGLRSFEMCAATAGIMLICPPLQELAGRSAPSSCRCSAPPAPRWVSCCRQPIGLETRIEHAAHPRRRLSFALMGPPSPACCSGPSTPTAPPPRPHNCGNIEAPAAGQILEAVLASVPRR